MVRGRSLPRNVEAPPALPITSAEPTSAVPSWINSGGASASPLLKRAQLNGASMAAKEEVNKVKLKIIQIIICYECFAWLPLKTSLLYFYFFLYKIR